ncbi:MAG: ComEC family competence protein [Anaerolineales bacterium]
MRLFSFSMAWLAGIGISRAVSIDSTEWSILAGISLAALLLFRRNPLSQVMFSLSLFFSLGGLRYVTSLPRIDANHVASHNDRGLPVTIEGIIVASPDLRDTYTGLKIEAQRIQTLDGEQTRVISGRLLAYVSPFEEYSYGDSVRLTGFVETPPVFETFSYREYLARQGIHSLMQDPVIAILEKRVGHPLLQSVYDFRGRALEIVQKIFPDPEASLLAGILLGIESGISPEVRTAFDKTGTTHIIAISGFNITIISALLRS